MVSAPISMPSTPTGTSSAGAVSPLTVLAPWPMSVVVGASIHKYFSTTQVVAQPEWKSDLERNYLTDDFAVGERFRAELKQDYASMKAVLVELGLAKN